MSELNAQLRLDSSEPTLSLLKSDMYSKDMYTESMYARDMYEKQEFPSLSSFLLDKNNSSSPVSFQKDYVFNCYGFFCKQEAKRDQKSSIPVRMRLGD